MTTTNGQHIAAIYVRVSTTEQADKGFSLPTQIEACRALARQEGYTVPEQHVLKHDGKGGHYDIAPEEALLVQDIFRWYVQDGQSMHAITVRLIQGGVPTPWEWRGKGA